MEKFTLVNLAFLKKIDKDNLLILVLYQSLFFLTKNLYSSLNIYLTEKMFMNVRIETSLKLLNKYLKKNYDFLNKNSSIIVRNVTNETSLAISFINSLFKF